MKIHEYQAKELLRKYGVPTPQGRVAFANSLGGYPVVVKAQIHAGGRGKGGGVKLAQSEQEVGSLAGQIIGMKLITHQTGPRGQEVKKVLVEQGLNIAKELYLSIIPDRAIWTSRKWRPKPRKKLSKLPLIPCRASRPITAGRSLLALICHPLP